MKKIAVSIFLISFLFLVSSCGPNTNGVLKDFYGEYSFELPFNHDVSNWQASMFFFTTDYKMEQMSQLLDEAGYGSSLHENCNVKTILISAVKNEFTYYFIIYDKNFLSNEDVYTLSNASTDIPSNEFETDMMRYVFLAPLHILEPRSESNTRKVYGSFEQIASFYRATGKNDVEIDDVNKTITFKCEGNPDFRWADGMVIMTYNTTETGNYLAIKPILYGQQM